MTRRLFLALILLIASTLTTPTLAAPKACGVKDLARPGFFMVLGTVPELPRAVFFGSLNEYGTAVDPVTVQGQNGDTPGSVTFVLPDQFVFNDFRVVEWDIGGYSLTLNRNGDGYTQTATPCWIDRPQEQVGYFHDLNSLVIAGESVWGLLYWLPKTGT